MLWMLKWRGDSCWLCSLIVLSQFPLGFLRKRFSFRPQSFNYVSLCSLALIAEMYTLICSPVCGILGLLCHIIGSRFCVFGITGGIASGKTTLANFLMRNNFCIIDADSIARQVLKPGSAAYRSIVSQFGTKVLNPGDMTVNRSILRNLIFNDQRNATRINRITHGYIFAEILRQLAYLRILRWKRYVVIVAPLLFETKLNWLCSPIITTYVEEETQIRRLILRDSTCTKDIVDNIIRLQKSSKEKCKLADVVLDNNGCLDILFQQAKNFFATNYNLNMI